ncbi:hypothetical protein O181_058804 [Austropuccinia psidii MF-1]|uniref:Uncharacterized protein n=1 Tax=Austropuccinia psidii MF-1 TaxID=1389203 RepID=A0A9Q3ED39_9BASI|nr:hypothetical protein [Austropuccinia psidii MF-1]
MIEEDKSPSNKAIDSPFFTTPEEQPCNNLSASTQISAKTPGKPGWEIKLTSNKEPKTVSADLDESNILQTRQRANMASISSNSPNPKNWNEAICFPD